MGWEHHAQPRGRERLQAEQGSAAVSVLLPFGNGR